MRRSCVRAAMVATALGAVLVLAAAPAAARDAPPGADGADVATLPPPEGALSASGDGASTLATPAMTVAPDDDLRHGDTVTVAGTGFSPNAQIGVVQCQEESTGVEGCDLGTLVYTQADATGAWSTPFAVRRVLSVGFGGFDCNTPPGCGIGAANIASPGYSEAGSASIVFADEPLPPAPIVDIDPTGSLTHLQRVGIEGSGFAPNAFVFVAQCVQGTGQCNFSIGFAQADATGAVSIDAFIVQRVVGTHGAELTDCLEAPCVLRFQGGDPLDFVEVPLDFVDVSLPPAPLVSVDPSTGLAASQEVTVSGSGYGPGLEVLVVQCSVESTFFFFDCIFGPTVLVDGDGSFQAAMTVSRHIPAFPAPIDCAQLDACVVAAFSYDDLLSSAGAPIQFASTPDPGPDPGPGSDSDPDPRPASTVVAGARQEAAATGAGTLPVTGSSPTFPARAGVTLLVLGALLVTLAHAGRRNLAAGARSDRTV